MRVGCIRLFLSKREVNAERLITNFVQRDQAEILRLEARAVISAPVIPLALVIGGQDCFWFLRIAVDCNPINAIIGPRGVTAAFFRPLRARNTCQDSTLPAQSGRP